MEQYAIYDHPKDYPDSWVVRRWLVAVGSGFDPVPILTPHSLSETLEDARDTLPPGLTMIPALSGDDPVIKEVWL